MPVRLTVQELAIDDASIFSQGQPISTDKSRARSEDSRSESQPSTAPRVHAPFWQVWWKEMFCIITSIASLIAIVVVLALFDNHSLPSWPHKITLNTFLALFTTLAKGSFMLPVSIALSQSKFTWFLKPKPLNDFYVLDQASRGWLGSMKLLFRVRFKHTVAIGAILMVVSILSSPVTQLAISYPLRNDTAPREEATVLTINEINLEDFSLVNMVNMATLMASVTNTGNYEGRLPPQKASCSTGNCNFNPYQSLGVCVESVNITSELRIQAISNLTSDLTERGRKTLTPGQSAWDVGLSSKYGFIHQSELAIVLGQLDGTDTFGFLNNTSLLNTKIASFFLIYTTPLPPNETHVVADDSDDFQNMLYSIRDFDYEAREIMFHLCVQTFETKVRTAVEETYITDPLSRIDDPRKGFILGPKCTMEQSLLLCKPEQDPGDLVAYITPPNSRPTKFSASYATMFNIGVGISYTLLSSAGLSIVPNGRLWVGEFVWTWFNDVLYTEQNIFNSTRRETHLDNFFLGIASSITSDLRTTHHQFNRPGAVVIEGTPLKEIAYVHISWGWISFLAIEIVAAVLFLVIVITAQGAVSRERGPESVYVPADAKDSALATLVVLSNDCREALSDGLQPAGVLQKTSKMLQVTLRGNEFELASDTEVQSSQSGKDSLREVLTEENGLPQTGFLSRIFPSIRGWQGKHEVSR
ncbi:hypothetical protein BDP55DRAFT_542332 [Colletotrichum godetiae]|uniref:Uncharacterized protein n=1 Tax=Colletotrichum godetiae TaxID=1209918 RepID=A0AAJ0AYQ7_9PEZI|nr:uncharacterized protein BDP55DRAFT_542332 [Colletotrichum godetiae]KAK1691471.1 hypothetical protein BDP55DRAFT_542332 [Colletotrichum godetiae]